MEYSNIENLQTLFANRVALQVPSSVQPKSTYLFQTEDDDDSKAEQEATVNQPMYFDQTTKHIGSMSK